MNKYTDFEPLRLELIHFSKYLVFDKKKEGISCCPAQTAQSTIPLKNELFF